LSRCACRSAGPDPDMMRAVLFLVRAPLVATWVLLGLGAVVLIFPLASMQIRGGMTRHWSRMLMAVCGVGLRVQGQPRSEGAALWVANHVSWVDIFVLNSVRPTAFIAKSDIRNWP